jgi:5-methylcytosine-specific restriction endonuclease McrA
MKPKILDGVEVWKEFEDVSARLGLSVIERAVYSWLLRHTQLEGKLRERFTVTEVADKVGISKKPALQAIRRLADHGALRFIERSYSGHRLEVRLPAEIPAARYARDKAKRNGAGASLTASPSGLRASRRKMPSEANIEEMDFFVSPALRKSIHAREGGNCFWCMRRTTRRSRCLDHVVPRAKSGENSYRNVVSCCVECNWQKKDHPAEDFLRELYRGGQLSRKDLTARLAAGKLRPRFSTDEDSISAPAKP